jgi:hypothetical protein
MPKDSHVSMRSADVRWVLMTEMVYTRSQQLPNFIITRTNSQVRRDGTGSFGLPGCSGVTWSSRIPTWM